MSKASTTKAENTLAKPSDTSIWTRFNQQKTPAKTPRVRRFLWVVDAALPLALIFIAGVAVVLPGSLSYQAKMALFAFLLAAILWSMTSIGADYVALIATMLLILSGGTSQEKLFDALASDVIWLMIGAFVLGSAVQKTGLASRLTTIVVERSRSVSSIFWLMTTALIPLSFLIPSTSGRAAVVTPVFQSIANAAEDRRITRALSLLMPTVILVSTISTIIGAGSHLIANDLLYQISKQSISFTQWMVYGLPFGVVASYISCWVILRLFLDKSRRDRTLEIPLKKPKPLSRSEWKTLIIVTVMISLWVTENWHKLEIATVTMIGALLLTAPGFGVLKWKDGIKAVSWKLIIFVGAALVLGRNLIESGAAQWIIDQIFAVSNIAGAESRLLIFLLLAFISLTSHLYMTSHAARAAALVPALLYLASSLQLNPTAVLFISTVGMDYCLTFPVSSKALLIFQELEGETYKPSDLLRLSSVLLLVHLGLMLLFYFSYWRWVGLQL